MMRVMFPQLAHYTDFALVLLRLMAGLVFIDSGYNDLKSPGERGKGLGVPKASRFSWGQSSCWAERQSSSVF